MKVVVLAGGISTERDVSLISGKLIYQAMKRLGHQAVLLDVYLGMERDDIDGIFESEEDFAADIADIREINPDISEVKARRKDGGKCYFGPNVIRICQMADAVFLGLHGEDGENGRLQAAFDLLGIRYTGTDYVSSALAMDKALAKELFAANGIPTPAGAVLKKGQAYSADVPYPRVVKVCKGGSSIGVYIVKDEAEYDVCWRERRCPSWRSRRRKAFTIIRTNIRPEARWRSVPRPSVRRSPGGYRRSRSRCSGCCACKNMRGWISCWMNRTIPIVWRPIRCRA